MRDRDAHIAAAEQARRDMLDVHIGRSVGLDADRPEPVGRILRERCRGPHPDEEHLPRTRDRRHRLLEPKVIDSPNAFRDRVGCGGEDFEEHRAHRVCVGDVPVVERLGPGLTGQSDLEVTIAPESHPLATADHRRW